MTTVQARVDPVTAAVIAGALDSIAVEMGHKLARMSFSSIIRESEDFGCVICDDQARQLCESSQSTPLQSGPIPGYIRGINRRFAELGTDWKPGDVVIHNHAYYGASHQPDVGFCVPIFHRGELVGFSATTAHHLDLGALTPGTCGIVDATDAYAEGLQFAAIKVEEEGRRNEWIWQLIWDNVRAAHVVVGDMGAQVAAAKAGAARFLELIDRYGLQTVRDASEDLMDYSDRMLRREIERLPDGTYSAEGHLDGFVDDPDPSHKNLRIAVAVTIEGSEVTVDLTGTSPQIDLPINMPFEGTVDIAVWMTLRSILLDSATHDPVPT
ncbi:MAG TPA: hydantoinase B/oxoprolinase family protein, partial [Solirubrobacteraceae bacterium]|nr:hydantoinase B/oxoprolinase family protein [Solirubrobacteraceae bacterium]